MDIDATRLLDLAVTTAQETGRMLVEGQAGASVVQTKSSPTDIVTEMDKAADDLVSRRLREARPEDALLTEESGASAGGSGVRWVVDPIDGTVNYLYGMLDWAVSIAAEVDGEAVAGVVEVPARGETYTAVRGRGAWRTRAGRWPEPIFCSTGVPLNRALVATGFGYASERRAHQAEVLVGVLPNVRDIRRGGSAAVDLCSLACGRVDAYYERGVNAWDVGAAGLIAAEAGARVGGLAGRPASPEMTIAAPEPLFTGLNDLLIPLDPERDA
jgi:myo-inositol-1(or 4)-monophosphatase